MTDVRKHQDQKGDGCEWSDPVKVAQFLNRSTPHRAVGEATLLEVLPPRLERVLDIGTGDGRLIEIVCRHRSGAEAVGLDLSQAMLEQADRRFSERTNVRFVQHDLASPMPSLGKFDAVVSGLAIHHLNHRRKRTLYEEVHRVLEPGGLFANLDVVTSPTRHLHEQFLIAIGRESGGDDPSDQPASINTQLQWLLEIGFSDVTCLWKWRGLALMVGTRGG